MRYRNLQSLSVINIVVVCVGMMSLPVDTRFSLSCSVLSTMRSSTMTTSTHDRVSLGCSVRLVLVRTKSAPTIGEKKKVPSWHSASVV